MANTCHWNTLERMGRRLFMMPAMKVVSSAILVFNHHFRRAYRKTRRKLPAGVDDKAVPSQRSCGRTRLIVVSLASSSRAIRCWPRGHPDAAAENTFMAAIDIKDGSMHGSSRFPRKPLRAGWRSIIKATFMSLLKTEVCFASYRRNCDRDRGPTLDRAFETPSQLEGDR